jgi:hypothetical protein
MTAFKSKPVPQLNWSLLPAHYDQWGFDTERALEQASSVSPVWLMSWHDHVVAEGYVAPDDPNLKRALEDLQ